MEATALSTKVGKLLLGEAGLLRQGLVLMRFQRIAVFELVTVLSFVAPFLVYRTPYTPLGSEQQPVHSAGPLLFSP